MGQEFCSGEYQITSIEDAVFGQYHVTSAFGGHLVCWQMLLPANICGTVERVLGLGVRLGLSLGFGLGKYHITSRDNAIFV